MRGLNSSLCSATNVYYELLTLIMYYLNPTGAAVLVMERQSGENAIRHLHNKKTKEGLSLAVRKAFNQSITRNAKMQLSEDNRTKRRRLTVAFEDDK